MENLVSVIIPNYNGASTIGKCLEAALASSHENFEIIVADDASQDNSVELISQFPCKLARLAQHGGAAKARNIGAQQSRGEILFFTDADCLLQENTLRLALATLASAGPRSIVGGTYTLAPYDRRFCSRFQSVFIHYFETKHAPATDYVATHALAMRADLFREFRGFAEDSLPILEDVEFSHRLRRAGICLLVNPAIQVRHIFDYSLYRSLRNAYVKSKYWTRYAIGNRDLLADSGTASRELKLTVAAWTLNGLLLTGYLFSGRTVIMMPMLLLLACNLYASRGLLLAFHRAEGMVFAVSAAVYYLLVYPAAVVCGALAGLALALRNPARTRGGP